MIGWIGNTNLDPVRTADEPCYVAPFDQYMNELLNERSKLYTEPVDAVVLFLSGEEFLKDLWYVFPDERLKSKAVEEIRNTLSAARQFLSAKPDTVLIMNTIVLPPNMALTYLDSNSADSFTELEDLLNKEIKGVRSEYPNFLVLDWKRLVRLHGYYALVSDKFSYLGRIKLTEDGFSALSRESEHLLNAYRGKSKKVLALDLDNVLWGGIVGEAGRDGIELSEDDLGKAYRDFQKSLKALKDTGVLLAIVSKNNEADARDAFRHPMMALAYDDFVSMRVNWKDKAENLVDIAKELDLGLDAFVFIDDSPVERQRVRSALPEVTVPEFPEDPTQLKRWFLEEVVYVHFARTSLTAEDKGRGRLYEHRARRQEYAKKLDPDSFLKMLDIRLTPHVNDAAQSQRITQLTQRTNQFNLTTRRYEERAIREFMRSGEKLVFGLDYEDKFGKEGTIAAALVGIDGEEAVIDALVMSCRVIGRRVEHGFLTEIVNALKDRGVRRLKGEFIPTAKNEVCAHFYAEAGFDRLSGNLYEKKIS